MPRISRRQFFKASAFGAGAFALSALGLASIAAAPTREAQAAAGAARRWTGPGVGSTGCRRLHQVIVEANASTEAVTFGAKEMIS